MNAFRIIGLCVVTSIIVSTIAVQAQYGLERSGADGPLIGQPADGGSMTLAERDEAVVETVQRAEPAVASVIISKDLPVIEQYFETVPFGDGFSIRIPRQRQSGTELRQVGGGTAFFISEDGLMLTNKHVVSDADATYTVLLNDGRRLDAAVLARDPLSDIALIKVEGSGFPHLGVSADRKPVLGQSVIAIGNALAEFRNTVSVGVVSGLQRSITAGDPASGTAEELTSIIQTDAAINAGNSGGPLLDLAGNVIGMNTAVAVQAQNIGFALPASELSRAIESYERHGRIVRPYIGIRYVEITPETAETLDLPHEAGVLLQGDADGGMPAILPGSPAEKAGLREGDIITAIDGTAIADGEATLGAVIRRGHIGETLALTVVRGGREMQIPVVLEELPDNQS